jgi:hypothetical protein
MTGEPKAVPLHAAINSWRSWLTTGARRAPIDTRRARGGDVYRKKVLMGRPSGAADFSSAMARQAIDEAMSELPTQHKQVVKLAYFGGLTNREIALQLGLTVGGVRRRLREGLAIVSDQVERGRATARRAVHGFVMWLTWRRFGDTAQHSGPALDQVVQAGMVAVMAVAATALIAGHQAPAAQTPHPQKVHRVAAAETSAPGVAQPQLVAPSTQAVAPIQGVKVSDAVSQVAPLPELPLNLQVPALPVSVPVQLPALPSPGLH